jgi:hypothetical protein
MIKMSKLLVLLLASSCAAYSAAIDVTYTISGSPGAWDLNFTVANNLTPASQDIYRFGVLLSGPGITGSPAGYDPTVIGTWTNFFMGGSSNLYNNIWDDEVDFNHLLAGSSLDGFVVHVTDAVAPASVPWFAFAYPSSFDPGEIFTGPEAFASDPSFGAGFESVAEAPVVAADAPEPWSMGLLLSGLTVCTYYRRRKR